jgi:hypothetical protein
MAEKQDTRLDAMRTLLKQLETTKAETEKLIQQISKQVNESRDRDRPSHPNDPAERRRVPRRKSDG